MANIQYFSDFMLQYFRFIYYLPDIHLFLFPYNSYCDFTLLRVLSPTKPGITGNCYKSGRAYCLFLLTVCNFNFVCHSHRCFLLPCSFFLLFKHNIFSDDCPQLYRHEGLSSNITKIFLLYHT